MYVYVCIVLAEGRDEGFPVHWRRKTITNIISNIYIYIYIYM